MVSDYYSEITAPITGDEPFGADVNYDADYERLKSEMGKLGDIDVDLVESLSYKIITEKSKDVRALVFLAYAVLRNGNLCRLADVFSALAEYCENDMVSIYPRRDPAKVAALRWLAEPRFMGSCDKLQMSASDLDDTERLVEAFAKLRSALDAKFGDSAPPLSSLYKKAAEWKKAAERASAASVVEKKVEVAARADDAENDGESDTEYSAADLSGEESAGVLVEILGCLRRIEKLLESRE